MSAPEVPTPPAPYRENGELTVAQLMVFDDELWAWLDEHECQSCGERATECFRALRLTAFSRPGTPTVPCGA